jgi:hypothetical protein
MIIVPLSLLFIALVLLCVFSEVLRKVRREVTREMTSSQSTVPFRQRYGGRRQTNLCVTARFAVLRSDYSD